MNEDCRARSRDERLDHGHNDRPLPSSLVTFEEWVLVVFDPDAGVLPLAAGTALVVGDTDLPITDRVACVRAIPTLYRDLLAPRCAPRLGHLGEQEGRLEMITYMFWDIAAFGGVEGTRDGNLLEDAVLETLDDVLRIDHVACQESAIHGLGHRFPRHPERAPAILRMFLRRGPIADDRLVPYAESATSGCIL